MKKGLLSFVVFVVSFVAVYLVLCFMIPGLRIKLDAAPAEYFIESVTHMVGFKMLIALVVGVILGAISLAICRKK